MAERPNIILIIADQQRYDTINALGYPYVDTPNLDRLVREGMTFENCFITAPSCAPARASLFTGYFPHTTGIHKNGDRWTRSWVERLNDSGYHCVNVGKMHTQPFETTLGFGTAASPVLFGDRLYVVNDNVTESFIAAFDKETGEEIWRVPRDERGQNWSTPFVWENELRTEIVTAGTRSAMSWPTWPVTKTPPRCTMKVAGAETPSFSRSKMP